MSSLAISIHWAAGGQKQALTAPKVFRLYADAQLLPYYQCHEHQSEARALATAQRQHQILMYVSGPLPLRITVRSRAFTFGASYMTAVSNAVAGTLVTCTQAPQTAILNATFEAELHSASANLGKAFPDLAGGPITVAYLQDGVHLKEPYFRVMVHTPEECYGDIVGDLNRRLGLIEGMADSSVGLKIVTVTAPSSELIGYNTFLKEKTRGVGHVDYEFLGYDKVWPRPLPPDPKDPAMAKRA